MIDSFTVQGKGNEATSSSTCAPLQPAQKEAALRIMAQASVQTLLGILSAAARSENTQDQAAALYFLERRMQLSRQRTCMRALPRTEFLARVQRFLEYQGLSVDTN